MAAILASDWLLDMTHPAYTDIKMGRAGKKERGKILAPKLKAYVRHQAAPAQPGLCFGLNHLGDERGRDLEPCWMVQ